VERRPQKVSGNAEVVFDVLSQTQLDFIEQEFGYTREVIASMSDDEVDELYDQIADIEVDETVDADRDGRDLTERGKTAEGIVTVIGNELYRPDDEPDMDE
jgi:predicted Zn-dependent protease with MMP-like domain